MGLLFTALFLPFTRPSLVLLGAEEEAATLGLQYLPYLSATLPMVVSSVCGQRGPARRGRYARPPCT